MGFQLADYDLKLEATSPFECIMEWDRNVRGLRLHEGGIVYSLGTILHLNTKEGKLVSCKDYISTFETRNNNCITADVQGNLYFSIIGSNMRHRYINEYGHILCISMDELQFACFTSNSIVSVYNYYSTEPEFTFKAEEHVRYICLMKSHLAILLMNNQVIIFDIPSKSCVGKCHSNEHINAIIIISDNRALISTERKISLVDFGFNELCSFKTPSKLLKAKYINQNLILSFADNTIRVYSSNGTMLKIFRFPSRIRDFDSDGNDVAAIVENFGVLVLRNHKTVSSFRHKIFYGYKYEDCFNFNEITTKFALPSYRDNIEHLVDICQYYEALQVSLASKNPQYVYAILQFYVRQNSLIRIFRGVETDFILDLLEFILDNSHICEFINIFALSISTIVSLYEDFSRQTLNRHGLLAELACFVSKEYDTEKVALNLIGFCTHMLKDVVITS